LPKSPELPKLPKSPKLPKLPKLKTRAVRKNRRNCQLKQCRPSGARYVIYIYPPFPARMRSPSGWAKLFARLRRWSVPRSPSAKAGLKDCPCSAAPAALLIVLRMQHLAHGASAWLRASLVRTSFAFGEGRPEGLPCSAAPNGADIMFMLYRELYVYALSRNYVYALSRCLRSSAD
jgi:hypothetical protein